jgi:hypothetical protein
MRTIFFSLCLSGSLFSKQVSQGTWLNPCPGLLAFLSRVTNPSPGAQCWMLLCLALGKLILLVRLAFTPSPAKLCR